MTTPHQPHTGGIPEDIMKAADSALVAAILELDDQNGNSTAIIAKAILAERERHSAVRRLGASDAEMVRELIAVGKVFSDTNPEARFIAEADLSCPHCGGSGHKDDVQDQPHTDGWIEWTGGACPVSPHAAVDVMFADGSRHNDYLACQWNWNIDVERHLSEGGDGGGVISSYRLSPSTIQSNDGEAK